MKISKYIIHTAVVGCILWIAAGCQDLGHDIPFNYPPEQEDNLRPDPPAYNPMKLYMTFDDNLSNSSRYTMVATPTGTAEYSEGAVNSALKCGEGKYILVSPSETIYKGNVNYADTLADIRSLSFVTWYYLPKSSAGMAQNLFSISNTGKWWGNLDVFVDGDNKIKVHIYNYKTAGTPTDAWVDFDYKATGAVLVDKWVQFAVTYDGATSTLKTYLNGEEKTSATIDGFGPLKFENVGPMVIGNWAQNTSIGVPGHEDWAIPFKGDIDQLRLYNKSLNASEILTLYSSEKPNIPDYSPLKLWLKFEDNITDASNYAIPTAATGAMSYVDAVSGRGLQCGAGKYILATPTTGTKFNLADTLANLGGFTFATWFYYPTDVANMAQELFSISNTAKEWGNLDVFIDGTEKIKVHVYNYVTGAPVDAWVDVNYKNLGKPILDKWMHYAVSYNPATSEFKTYIDGELMTTQAVAGYGNIKFENMGPMVIGNFPQNTTIAPPALGDWAVPFEGRLDQLRFYNKPVSDADILAVYNSEKSNFPDPLMWLKFDDNVTDQSGNAIATVATGAPTYAAGISGNAMQCGDGKYVLATPAGAMANTLNNPGSFTFSTWMRFDASNADGAQMIFSMINTVEEWDNVNVFADWGGGVIKAHFFSYDAGAKKEKWIEYPADIKDRWLLFTVTYDQASSTFKIYENGTLKITSQEAGYGPLKFDNAGQILIGCFPKNTIPPIKENNWGWQALPFKGLLDNLRIYDVALNDGQVARLYTSELPD